MVEILNVHTEHVIPIKTLFEVLKEILSDVTIKFIADKIEPKTEPKTETKQEADTVDDTDKKKIVKKLKKPLKGKKTEEPEPEVEKEEPADKIEKKQNTAGGGGIKILSVDSTKTVMIVLKLDSKQFFRFKCNVPELAIGVNLNMFNKLIRSVDKDCTLTLQYDDSDREHVNIIIENQEKPCKTINQLKLLDLDENDIKVPITSFDAVITMSSSDFHGLCKEMNGIAEYIDIKCTPNNVTFTCKGDCASRSTAYTTHKNNINIKFIQSDSNKANIVQGIFELKNLVLFSKCSNLCDEIQIYMKNNYPLVINYTIATLGKLIICIAPKTKDENDTIQNDEEEDDNENDDSDDEVYEDNAKIKYKNEEVDSD